MHRGILGLPPRYPLAEVVILEKRLVLGRAEQGFPPILRSLPFTASLPDPLLSVPDPVGWAVWGEWIVTPA